MIITSMTSAGSITVTDWKTFLALIPIQNVDHGNGLRPLNVQIAAPDDINDEFTYQRRLVPLVAGTITDIKPAHVLAQLPHAHIYKDSLTSIIETQAVESMINFGNPTYIVRIAPRTWLMANPDNFSIYRSPKGIGLVCTSLPKIRLVTILKVTEAETLDKLVAQWPEMKEQIMSNKGKSIL